MSPPDQDCSDHQAGVKPQSVLPVSMQDQSTIAISLSLVVLSGMLYFLFSLIWRDDFVQVESASPLICEFQVDINSAEWPEIAALPDIGPTRARQIVQWRQTNGPFRAVDDLQKIRGIGPATLQSIGPYLRCKLPVRHVVSKSPLAANNSELDRLDR